MHLALHLGAQKLIAHCDSQLIVNQLNGELESRENNMVAYLTKAQDEAAKFKCLSLLQAPTEQNSHADIMASVALAIHTDERQIVEIES